MNLPWDQIVVGLIIAAAVLYLLRSWLPRKGKACSGGCCSIQKPKIGTK